MASGEDANLQSWAKEVAQALFPAGLEVFPRHRWKSSWGPQGEVLLLRCVHGVLQKTLRTWLQLNNSATSFQLMLYDALAYEVAVDELGGMMSSGAGDSVNFRKVVVERLTVA